MTKRHTNIFKVVQKLKTIKSDINQSKIFESPINNDVLVPHV